MRRWWAVVALLVVGPAPAGTPAGQGYRLGTVGLGVELARLRTTARVLHVGAHPDDEDSALLAALARGRGARTAYLSLTRGEGGQNSLGPELFAPLGLIRTEELLSARNLDGAEQFFGQAYDFGFSKSADETLAKWGREATLGDLVAVIRRFRPQVIVSRFAGDAGDGHGHHQAAGLLCREAFRAAADPARFPEQLAAGWLPWQASRLYLDRWDGPARGASLELGELSPLFGRSYLALALEGRSQHRSQDMGRTSPLGPRTIHLRLLDSVDGADPRAGLLDGLAVDLVDAVPPGDEPWRRTARGLLVEASAGLDQATALFGLNQYPRQTVHGLVRVLRALRRVRELLDEPAVPAGEGLTMRLAVDQKIAEASTALALAAGVQLDALADRRYLVPGETVTVAAEAFWGQTVPVDGVRFKLLAPADWGVETVDPPDLGNYAPAAREGYRLTVPPAAAASQPYWLRQPLAGDRWPVPASELLGQPLAPPLLAVNLRCAVGGAVLSLDRPVTYRWADPRQGERRELAQVKPAVTAAINPAQVLLPPGAAAPLKLTVTLTNHAARETTGQLVGLVAGEPRGPVSEVSLAASAERALELTLTAPALTAPTDLTLVWRTAGGDTPLDRLQVIDYDHIPSHLYLAPASVKLVPVAVTVTATGPIGYVPGPGDETPEALARLGVAVRWLEAEALAAPPTELRTIVVGARAYETNAALRRHNDRLLAWARAGGRLVVLYQKYDWPDGGFAPWPVTLGRPHDRVTDETAPVRLPAPDHPLVSRPNRLGEADFAGWVQERGLYFLRTWPAELTPLLACADPGEPEQLGGLLAGPLGQGEFIYCAYALFRQFPAGTPGAYRLLANLVSR